jgi:F0F1-type ATP synthase membrane subunit b/b'
MKKDPEWKEAKKEYKAQRKELRKERMAAKREWREAREEARREMRSARKETRRGGKIGGNVRQEKGEKKQVVWLVVENLAP